MDENINNAPIPNPEPEEKPKKVNKHKRWREIKKARRAQRKAYYSEAPALIRAWHLWLGKTLAILLVLAMVVGIGGYVYIESGMLSDSMVEYAEANKRNPVAQERIYELSPLDEEGAARIDAEAPPHRRE